VTSIATALDPAADRSRLRACVRDLVALATMPSWWIGRSPLAIDESLRDLLASMLRADVVYVQHRDTETEQSVVAVCGASRAAAENALRGLDQVNSRETPVLADTSPPVRLATFPIGLEGELGRLAVGSRRPEFPSDLDKMLLGVAAENQHAHARERLAKLTKGGDAVAAGHLEIEHDDVRGHPLRECQCRDAVLGFADDGKVGSGPEEEPESLAHQGVVVDEKHAHGLVAHRYAAPRVRTRRQRRTKLREVARSSVLRVLLRRSQTPRWALQVARGARFTALREFHRVAEKVGQHLQQTRGVGIDEGKVRVTGSCGRADAVEQILEDPLHPARRPESLAPRRGQTLPDNAFAITRQRRSRKAG
jgi:hypothetical protein